MLEKLRSSSERDRHWFFKRTAAPSRWPASLQKDPSCRAVPPATRTLVSLLWSGTRLRLAYRAQAVKEQRFNLQPSAEESAGPRGQVSSTKTHTLEKDVEAPLLDGPKQPMRPAPIRAIHAGLQFVFIVFGKEYGWAGFCLLVVGTAFSVATSVHVNWLGGCAVMMVFFACTFCFAGYQAVSGKYELARPLMFGAMMMFLSCILGGHFFVVWSKSASSQVIKDVPLSGLPKVTPAYDKNALFYLKDGSVGTGQTGAFKLCKDKLPVVGTCVYNYYCVAPILADGYSKGADVLAWVGIMAHVPCDDATFLKSPARMAWNHDYRSGLGIERNKHWDSAIDESVKKYGLVTNDHAPVINWMPNPTEEEQRAWHMGWMVESIVFMIYLVAMAIYSYTVGFTEEALPEARKIMDPEAPLKPPRRKKLDITVKK